MRIRDVYTGGMRQTEVSASAERALDAAKDAGWTLTIDPERDWDPEQGSRPRYDGDIGDIALAMRLRGIREEAAHALAKTIFEACYLPDGEDFGGYSSVSAVSYDSADQVLVGDQAYDIEITVADTRQGALERTANVAAGVGTLLLALGFEPEVVPFTRVQVTGA